MIECIQLEALQDNYNYLLIEPISRECIIIDPSEARPILSYLKSKNLTLIAILNTHHHWDHTDGNLELQRETHCKIFGNENDKARIPGITDLVQPGTQFSVNDHFKFQSFECSGHTIGHILFYHIEMKALFCGDALFSLGCGRMFEGTAAQYYDALKAISALPTDTLLFCGHEYTQKNLSFCLKYGLVSLEETAVSELQTKCQNGLRTIPSTIGFEKRYNPFLRTLSGREKINLGLKESASDVDTFARLRTLRNSF